MSQKFNIAVAGATGAVGTEIVQILEQRNFPIDNLFLLASSKSKGKKVEFKKVLLVNDDKTTEVGSPTGSGAMVEGLLLDNIKDKKVIVFKKRRRQNSRKRYGHRQPLSKIQITKILSKGGKVVSQIKVDKMKLSNDQKSDKKLGIKKTN